jgi:hypothetical protein
MVYRREYNFHSFQRFLRKHWYNNAFYYPSGTPFLWQSFPVAMHVEAYKIPVVIFREFFKLTLVAT